MLFLHVYYSIFSSLFRIQTPIVLPDFLVSDDIKII